MVLSEDDPKEKGKPAEPTETVIAREDWIALLFWLVGFLFLAVLALWDLVASLSH